MKSDPLGYKVFLFTNKLPDILLSFGLQLLSISQFLGVNTEAKNIKFNFSILNLKRKNKNENQRSNINPATEKPRFPAYSAKPERFSHLH